MQVEEILEEYIAFAQELAPFAAPVEEMLFEASQKNERILFEGAQGALLDNTFGTYPFVTPSIWPTLLGPTPMPKHTQHLSLIHISEPTRPY